MSMCPPKNALMTGRSGGEGTIWLYNCQNSLTTRQNYIKITLKVDFYKKKKIWLWPSQNFFKWGPKHFPRFAGEFTKIQRWPGGDHKFTKHWSFRHPSSVKILYPRLLKAIYKVSTLILSCCMHRQIIFAKLTLSMKTNSYGTNAQQIYWCTLYLKL